MEYFFHRPDIEYGSAAVWGPLGLVANRGLSLLQYEGVTRDLAVLPWGPGLDATLDALARPGDAIRRYGGWGRFLRKEFLPADLDVWEWAWAPNYTGHLLAGGISYRQLWEWFDAHGMAHSRVTAAVFYYATMMVNESLENGDGPPGNSSTVADLYFWDPAGMVLFSFDPVARFFAETLQAADWSPQASVSPGLRVLNNDQTMAYKVPLPFVRSVRLLVLTSHGGSAGLSVRLDGGYNLGATLGFNARDRIVDPRSGTERVEVQRGGGLFLDREGSLLASLTVSGAERIQANVFPGVLPGWLGRIGVWGGLDSRRRPSLGIATTRTLGLGFGFRGS